MIIIQLTKQARTNVPTLLEDILKKQGGDNGLFIKVFVPNIFSLV